MEQVQVLEANAANATEVEDPIEKKYGVKRNLRPEDIHVYNDDGKLITNPRILRSFAEGQAFLYDWLKHDEEWSHYDEDEEESD